MRIIRDGRKMKYPSEYNTWRHMRARCYNINRPDFSYYGGRGISVCSEWNDFRVFIADMGPCPPNHVLDRIHPNGNYERTNCRWANRSLSSFNIGMRKDNTSGIKGVQIDRGRWKAIGGKNGKKVFLGYFKTKEQAAVARKVWEDAAWPK